MNDKHFTHDEVSLMSIYNAAGTREGLIAALTEMRGYLPNVEALRAAQPKDLDASEIEVRLGATWIDKKYIQQFMFELLEPPLYARRSLEVNYSEFTAEWNISGKNSIP